jgi:hypothetical protein
MPSNTELNTGTGGDIMTTKQRSHDGDTTKQQVICMSGVIGTEDAYTFTDIQADGGTEANALRVTIANDSTGLVSVDDNGANLSIDLGGTVASLNTGVRDAGTQRVTVATDDLVPISAASLPLPAGAATEATLAGDLSLDQSHTRNEAFKEAAAVGGELDDAAPVAATEGNVSPARITAQRAIHVNLRDNSGTELTGLALAANQLADGHNVTIDNGGAGAAVNIQDGGNAISIDIGGTVPSLNTGVRDAGTQRVTVATDDLVPISAASLPLPSGAATAANQTSVIGTDGVAGPASVLSVGGTQATGELEELRVDSDGHLQVDVLTGGGGGTQYTEDAIAAADPVGTQPVMVADSTPALEVPDADVVAQRATRYGAAYCQIVDSSGSFVDTFGGGTQYVEGATDATITGTVMMMEDAADTLRAATGDVTNGLDVDVTRVQGSVAVTGPLTDAELRATAVPISAASLPLPAGAATAANQLANGHDVTIDNAGAGAAVNIQDGGNIITVDGTVTANAGTGTFNVDVTANTIGLATSANQLPDGHNVTVDNTVGAPANVQLSDGTETALIDASGRLSVSIDAETASVTVDAPTATPVNVQVGNGTIQAGIIDETAVTAVDALAISGGTPHDAVDSGNPIKMGAKAVELKADPTAVAAADRTDLYATREGQLFTIGGHPNTITRSSLVAAGDGAQTDNDALTDPVAANNAVVLTRLSITCSNANSVDVDCRVGFGTANVPTPALAGVAGMVHDFRAIPPGGGITIGDGSGIIGIGASNEELRFTCSVPTGGHITLSATFFLVAI